MLCRLLGYSKQAYYQYHQRSERQGQNEQLALRQVLSVRQRMPRLGTRKLYHLLANDFKAMRLGIGRDKLFALLRHEGLLVHKQRKYVKTTMSRHWMRKHPNLVKGVELIRPEQVWVADITYIATKAGHQYLHLITDAYSKQIMGYELCNNLNASSSIKALKMALMRRLYPQQALIHHSDRGLQYCSAAYTNILKNNNISISMTEQSDPYENAIAERVNGILKDEFGLNEVFTDSKQLHIQTSQAISIYNNERPHLSINLKTPANMHKSPIGIPKSWKKTKAAIAAFV